MNPHRHTQTLTQTCNHLVTLRPNKILIHLCSVRMSTAPTVSSYKTAMNNQDNPVYCQDNTPNSLHSMSWDNQSFVPIDTKQVDKTAESQVSTEKDTDSPVGTASAAIDQHKMNRLDDSGDTTTDGTVRRDPSTEHELVSNRPVQQSTNAAVGDVQACCLCASPEKNELPVDDTITVLNCESVCARPCACNQQQPRPFFEYPSVCCCLVCCPRSLT